MSNTGNTWISVQDLPTIGKQVIVSTQLGILHAGKWN
jgi:hypothetical protein